MPELTPARLGLLRAIAEKRVYNRAFKTYEYAVGVDSLDVTSTAHLLECLAWARVRPDRFWELTVAGAQVLAAHDKENSDA